MAEVQRHGFVWEDDIRTRVFGLTDRNPYTAPHDVPRERNRFNSNETISIKTTGNSTLCMGDALRVFSYEDGVDHTCVAVQYAQTGDEKQLQHVYELDLTQRDFLWGNVTQTDIEELVALVKSMPPYERIPEIDSAIEQKKTELNARSGIMQFNPKIDSKKQRRLQCSIPKFETYARFIKSSTTEPIVRGVEIASSIPSGPRIRNRHG